ncbi:MFS transporter, DHA1 family, bicyclomycin/chloramphenicol resistance protein [Meinhardsimonia xiamenensis]|jgi:DHA1 family bicyclomycin/chloramphenicol resistance-like MFS transporter|uniref:MFS transporter, DHA1 family, bicyclomycin/chloramphenicol resistance protein n=1 Tax=Meinhardsimonia xiamenensis TaxID=990712 RepID=A0A1G9FM04_9RHOB|nr:multidrug effflux MFS transporter [Meinhardsimonia xiamenensis]PRX37778.1 DHA1 family bicyclomycin/chloramphenicol resistance-like MFS transporter [Meinhardsimonia xiamenensis]SDK89385.1 MFS transporter, DHA1 family, bicyclomycin/chloramphenicol resistance protein [Meinhardsimonia xiamenensis]
MSAEPAPRAQAAAHGPGTVEFIALVAMLFATVAFSIDAMLPAFPEIAAALTPEAPNRAQLVVTAFIFGMGLGTLFTGPLSDAFGRKPVIVAGAALYCLAALWAGVAGSLESLLAARVVQGLGAAAPRVVTLAIVRDLHAGRRMARVMSFAMMVFTLVPAVAPLMGAGIIALAGWRGIFAAFVAFSLVSTLWLALRQPETLPPEARRPFRAAVLVEGIAEVIRRRRVVLAILAQTLAFAMLFTNLASNQQVFDITFGRAASFPWWFAGIALIAGTGSFLNAQIVERLGMRRVAAVTLAVLSAISLAAALALWAGLSGDLGFAVYLFWNTAIFFSAGLTLGNLNALAMEPLGHIAGMAASIVGALATVGSVAIAVPLGLTFDGTPVPLMLGVAACALGALMLVRAIGD